MLLAFISFSLFPIFKHKFESQPVHQEALVRGLLTPLAFCDVSAVLSLLDP